ncbi:MAG: hypothetical protein ABJ383_11645 [Balneola sp.]
MSEKTIKSESFHYFTIVAFGAIFGTFFLIGGIVELLDPNGTINVKGVQERSDFVNTLPFILFGIAVLGLTLYYRLNHCLAEFNNNSILLSYRTKKVEVFWQEIKFAEIISYINGYVIKIHLSDGRTHTIETDKGKFKFKDLSNLKRTYYRTEMWEKLKVEGVRLIEE